jgi:hypothetical protein
MLSLRTILAMVSPRHIVGIITAGTAVLVVAALSVTKPLIISGRPLTSTTAANTTPLKSFSLYYQPGLLLVLRVDNVRPAWVPIVPTFCHLEPL